MAQSKTPPVDAQAQREAAEAKAQARADKAAGGNGSGSTKPAAKAKPKAAAKRTAYKAHVAERSKLVRLVPGYKNPASPKQQNFMDEAFRKALKKAGVNLSEVTFEDLLRISGLYGEEVAEGETPRTVEQATELLSQYADSGVKGLSTKPLKPLTKLVADEAAIRPRHVAAALIAYGWQIDGSAEQRLADAAPQKPAVEEGEQVDSAEGETSSEAAAEEAAVTAE